MAAYKDLSRRGLIRLNRDYDDKSDNALFDFYQEHSDEYEGVRPFEQIVERVDELSDKLKDKKDTVSESMMSRIDSVFDGVVKALFDEEDRCKAVLDEQADNDAYPDEA